MKSVLSYLLTVVGWLLLAAGGLLFFFGGRAIHEFGHIERLLAEVEADVLAVVIGLLGYAMKSAAENLNEDDSPEK